MRVQGNGAEYRTASESSLGCLSPSPSSGASHPSRRGRTPSRPSPLHPPTPAYPNNDRSPNCYAGGIGLSIGGLKRRFTQPLAFCPLIAFSEYRKMLRDATGYGFIEEFDEYASRSTLSPDNTETFPPPSPPSGRGDVLRIRSPESTRDTFRTVELFFLLAPPPLGGARSPHPRGRKFCG